MTDGVVSMEGQGAEAGKSEVDLPEFVGCAIVVEVLLFEGEDGGAATEYILHLSSIYSIISR